MMNRTSLACSALLVSLVSGGLLAGGCNKEDQGTSGKNNPTNPAPGSGPGSGPVPATNPATNPAPAATRSAGSVTPASAPGSAQEPVQVSATDLTEAFVKDSAAATEKYKDKHLTVSGTIQDTSATPNAGGFVTVTLAGATADGGNASVLCNFPAGDKDKVEALKKGDSAKITGQFSYYAGSEKRATLVTCSLAK